MNFNSFKRMVVTFGPDLRLVQTPCWLIVNEFSKSLFMFRNISNREPYSSEYVFAYHIFVTSAHFILVLIKKTRRTGGFQSRDFLA